MVTGTPCDGLPLPHVPTKSRKSRPTASTVESRLALAAVAKFSFMLKQLIIEYCEFSSSRESGAHEHYVYSVT